jgi:predicted RNA-binding Zn-ribbon protein involved in translation (DUF1610 family)
MLRSGEYGDALDFAREAGAEADKLTVPPAPKKVAVKKKKAVAVKGTQTAAKIGKAASAVVKCPDCGEELESSWSECPACGFKTG